MAIYRLFPSATGPDAPASYSGPFQAGVLFEVTSGGMWFEGYWWWVCPPGQSTSAGQSAPQSTAPQKFALWQVDNVGHGVLIPGATVTSGPLTPGQWNYVPLLVPVPLSIGVCYNACTGFTGNFPDTQGCFGAGQIYADGITSGPLSAFSDQSGSRPAPFSMSQGVYGVTASDPAALMPANGNQSDNLWMDLQVSDTAPGGSSYRLWPSYPSVSEGGLGISNDVFNETYGTVFSLSEPCVLNRIWHYSPPGVTVLPDSCQIWDIATRQVVPGTNSGVSGGSGASGTGPAWSGPAGSGWVSCAYSGITLKADDYITSVYTSGGGRTYTELPRYFAAGGPASAAGIVTGPLTSPSAANAPAPGNTRYQVGGLLFPDTYDDDDDGETRWVDVEVTPTTSASPPPPPNPATSSAFLTFFP